MRLDGYATLAAFDAFFARSDQIWVELTRDVVELATVIAGRFTFLAGTICPFIQQKQTQNAK
jgi:hypothetical protein